LHRPGVVELTFRLQVHIFRGHLPSVTVSVRQLCAWNKLNGISPNILPTWDDVTEACVPTAGNMAASRSL
jgi:hypothetical protein